jgi:hypothetical protein
MSIRGSQWCLAPGAGARFASISIRGSQRCLAPGAGARFASISIRDHKGAWHRARGRDLLAFRLGIAKVPGTGLGAKRRVLAGLVKSPNRWRWLAHGLRMETQAVPTGTPNLY